MLFKNQAQKIHVYAYDSTGAPKTGDAANITAYVSLDGTSNAVDDTNPAEVDATNMPGVYVFDLTAAETNCDSFALSAKSTTSNIKLDPIIGFTSAGAVPKAAAGANGGLPTTNGAKLNQTADLTEGQSIAVSDRTGFALTSAYDPAKTAAQAGDAMTLTAAYDAAKSALTTLGTNAPANWINAAAIADDAIDAGSIKADAVTKIQNGLATPTNITAGTITTVTNVTNAPSNGDFTAAMKTSLNAATPSVSVSLTPDDIADIAAGIIDNLPTAVNVTSDSENISISG